MLSRRDFGLAFGIGRLLRAQVAIQPRKKPGAPEEEQRRPNLRVDTNLMLVGSRKVQFRTSNDTTNRPSMRRAFSLGLNLFIRLRTNFGHERCDSFYNALQL